MHKYFYTELSGKLVKVISAEDIELALKRGSSERPEARYNRRGQDALYLSANESSARVAMQKYLKEIVSPLMLVEYEIELCRLVDLRHADAQELKALASEDWRSAIAQGCEPSSWQVSDILRKDNEVGLIDPSRKNPAVWHVTFFRWNEAGAPNVRMVGSPKPIFLN